MGGNMNSKPSVKVEDESQLLERENDLHFHLMMAEVVDHLRHAGSIKRPAASLRGVVAKFGDAHFFYNQRGEFCLLTGSLKS